MFDNQNLYRRARILKIISDFEGIFGLTTFQKLIYFLSYSGVKNIEFDFGRNNYGPYSSRLDYDLNFLDNQGLIEIGKKGEKVSLIPKQKEIERFFLENDINFEENRLEDLVESKIIAFFENDLKTLFRIELAATIHFLIINSEFPIKKAIFEEIENWETKKDKFDEELKEEIWDILENHKLIDKRVIELNRITSKLELILPGNDYALKFQRESCKTFKYLFSNQLEDFKIEDKINMGRKRLDITALNSGAKGFFSELRTLHDIKCPYIIFECKNLSRDPNNRELDQIYSQLSLATGHFGILVCRKINNNKQILKKLKDITHKDSFSKKIVLVIDDSDIKKMLESKYNNKEPDLVLREKLKEVLFNRTS